MSSRHILNSLVLAGLMLGAAAVLKYADHAHMIGADTSTRGLGVMMGLVLAFIGNFMPKSVPASRGATLAGGRWQSALRIGGWSFTIAGLAYAVVWAFAPLAMANLVSTVLVVFAMAVTFGYALWACLMRPRNENAAQ